MTAKHFIKLADTLRTTKPEMGIELGQWFKDVEAIVGFCRSMNPRFNRNIFIDYINSNCGPRGGKSVKKRKGGQ